MNMTMPIRIVSALLGATTILLAPVAPTHAAAVAPTHAAAVAISDFDNTTQLDVVQPADCVQGTEHLVGPERVSGQVVEHADGSINVVGDLTDDLTVEFSNGWTGVFTTKEHFALNTHAGGTQVLTNVHRDSTSVRDQNGVSVGVISFRAVEHFTFANGELRVNDVHARLTCAI
jgi:hypothetical protein